MDIKNQPQTKWQSRFLSRNSERQQQLEKPKTGNPGRKKKSKKGDK
jgi:hypothetical protein